MYPTNIPEPFDQLDALEQNIENTPMPAGAVFDDSLDTMLDELERSMETNESKPPLVPEEPEVVQKTSLGYLSQEQSQGTVFEQGSINSPPLPYYIEDQQQAAFFHGTPHRPAGRIGRRGGSGIISSHTKQPNQRYCPIEGDIIPVEACEDCEYYDENGDSDNSPNCTYYSEEES